MSIVGTKWISAAALCAAMAWTGSAVGQGSPSAPPPAAPQPPAATPAPTAAPAAPAAPAQPAAPASSALRDVVERAVQTHPEVGQVRWNRRAVEQELRQARAGYLPSLDVRGSIGHEWTNNGGSRNRANRLNGQSGWIDMNRYDAGFSVRQLVLDFGGTDREVERQIGRTESAMFRTADTANAIGLRAVEHYLEVLRTRRILEIAQQNLRVHEQILGRVQARARGGRGPQSDVDQGNARLQAARANLAAAQKQYGDAIANYIATVNERPDGLTDAAAPEAEFPANADEAANVAAERAPSVAAANADIRAAQAAIGIADARFLPRVDAEVNGNHLYNVGGVRGPSTDFNILLVGRWNLYRGGADVARKREAVARLFEARETLERAKREVSRETRVSWNAVQAARERRNALQQQLAANQRVRAAYSQQFDRGRRTLLDLLDIQNEIFTNESQLTTEDYTVRYGIFRTLAAQGRLLEALGITPPVEATRQPARNLFDGLRDDFRPVTQ